MNEISMQISNVCTENVKAFDILNLQTTWLVKREKRTLFAYIEELLRLDISGQWRKIRNAVRCTKIHLGDPSGYFHLLAIFRKVLYASSFLPIWSAARKTQTRTGSLLSAVEDKTNMALTKTATRKNSCLFAASPAKVSRSKQVPFESLPFFFFRFVENQKQFRRYKDKEILA